MKTIQTLLISTVAALTHNATAWSAEPTPAASKALTSTKLGLLARLEANKGKEETLAQFLMSQKPIVDAERAITTW